MDKDILFGMGVGAYRHANIETVAVLFIYDIEGSLQEESRMSYQYKIVL